MKLKKRLTSGEISERIANLQLELGETESQVNELSAKAIEQSVDEEAHRLTCDEMSALGPKVVHKRQILADLKVLHARAVEDERLERLAQLRQKRQNAAALVESETPLVGDLLKREDNRHRETVIELKTRILSAESDLWRARIDLSASEDEDYRITGVPDSNIKNHGSVQAIHSHYKEHRKDLRMCFNDVARKLLRLQADDLNLGEMESI